ncbi:protein-L-isoaspartate O-methyltransferase family protein [Pseudazoarcus pumilus]|uniref:Protein-L-isoaspartate O-methyltransferase n=1 Tax=Pseudazoarcus pumilus TaxID=2067960 RepID=A0A2I6S980_9RHOO|nr:protein-L-isoaspartate O-methyltransferase [Pseudazoarcus pumilus]AUN95826.1 protein-L-isoaspartate O-methyltransferase [Pseudazoarcus pumilus]
MTESFRDTRSTENESMLAEISLGACLMSEQLGRDTFDARVLDAMRAVPRHAFVPLEMQPHAYHLRPLPIGFDKSIANPLIVALMTDVLRVEPHHTVLEIGTGLGWNAALLSRLARQVYTMEIVDELAAEALERLHRNGFGNVELLLGNGAEGLPRHAPFDRILVTCAPQLIPPALLAQLAPGGRMVVPAGLPGEQMLMLVTRDADGHARVADILPATFGEMDRAELSGSM